jgi:hypothetical protein
LRSYKRIRRALDLGFRATLRERVEDITPDVPLLTPRFNRKKMQKVLSMQPVTRAAHLLGRIPGSRAFVQQVREKYSVLFRYRLCNGEMLGEVLQAFDQASHPDHFVGQRGAGTLIVRLPVEVVSLA